MDAFTLTTKTQAITRYAERRGFKSRETVAARMAEIERFVRLKLPLSDAKDLVIEMRTWAWAGPLNEWTWLDARLFDLAEYLSTDEEKLTIKELSDRFHAGLEATR